MTLRDARSASDSRHTGPQSTPRLRLKPKAPSTGQVDGAWWPHSNDLSVELPDLLAVLSVRLGPIDQVTYNFADWAAAPAKFPTGGDTVRLSGFYQQQGNTVEVIGTNRTKLVLLVVPSSTEPEHAHEILMSAATPNDASTVEGLLHD
ncbi:MAG: hypothetical protein QOG47_567 [Mycobacterium sp.]|nr:hypothetical protein [Mycobacterium sp.]